MANNTFPSWYYTSGKSKDDVCAGNNVWAWHRDNKNSKNYKC